MCGEGLSRLMLCVWNEILVGLQHVRAIVDRRQVLDLLPKNPTCFDFPSSTDKVEDLAKKLSPPLARANIEIFLVMNVQSSSISMKEQTLVCGGLTGSDWAAWTNQQETVL